MEWSSDFSSDASLAAIQDCKHKKLEAFDDMDKFLRLYVCCLFQFDPQRLQDYIVMYIRMSDEQEDTNQVIH